MSKYRVEAFIPGYSGKVVDEFECFSSFDARKLFVQRYNCRDDAIVAVTPINN